MNIFVSVLIAVIVGYLLGSISNGVLIGKIFFNIDVREQGSKNSGGTNTGRVLGKKFGLLTIVLDALKTLLAMLLILFIYKIEPIAKFVELNPSYYAYIAGFSACIGHTFPIFFNFKGGKAVACLIGICASTNWIISAIGLPFFFLILILTKYVSLGSILTAIACAIMSYIPLFTEYGALFGLNQDIFYSIFMSVVAIFITIRHSSNISRLLKGVENKVKWLDRKKVETKDN